MSTVHFEPLRQHAVRLSNRQYGQLRAILTSPKATLTLDEIAGFNQLTLGSNKRRGFVTETRRRDGVTLTWEGRQVLRAFEQADFMRRVSSMNFSSFLKLEPHLPKRRSRTETEPRSDKRAA